MAVRSAELGSGTFTGASAVTLFTCPADTTAIVKDAQISTTTTTTAYIEVVRGGVACRILSGAVSVAAPLQAIGRFVVLEPGDVIRVHSSSSGITGFAWVSGALLDGVA